MARAGSAMSVTRSGIPSATEATIEPNELKMTSPKPGEKHEPKAKWRYTAPDEVGYWWHKTGDDYEIVWIGGPTGNRGLTIMFMGDDQNWYLSQFHHPGSDEWYGPLPVPECLRD